MSIILPPEITEYKKAINPSLDWVSNPKEEDGTVNKFYYKTTIDNFFNQSIENLEQYQNIKTNKETLVNFIEELRFLSYRIVEAFILLEPCNTFDVIPLPENYNQINGLRINKFNFSKIKIKERLENIQGFENSLKTVKKKELLKLFNSCVLFVKNRIGIDVLNSPLKNDFENVSNVFKNQATIQNNLTKIILEKLNDKEEDLNKIDLSNQPQQTSDTENNASKVAEDDKNKAENDFILSTIEYFLEPISKLMIESDYTILVNSLKTYFDTGVFPTLEKAITINGRPNKRAIGWILNRLFESQGKGVELPLLHFCKNNISLFKDVTFDETNYLKSNLYTYLTSFTKYSTKET